MKEIIEVIDKIQGKGAEAVSYSVEKYTEYFFTQGVALCLIAIIIIIFSLNLKKIKSLEHVLDDSFLFLISALGVFIGLMMIAANITDVLNPEAYAIHQLIKDIKGK